VLQAAALRRNLSSGQKRASGEIVDALLAVSKIGELGCAEDHSSLQSNQDITYMNIDRKANVRDFQF
jgi:hypothetical protein